MEPLALAGYPRTCERERRAVFITFEATLSGMSLNPARSFGSSAVAGLWSSPWIYWTAPPLGMLLADEVYLRWRGVQGVFCAKLHHQNRERCIFWKARPESPRARSLEPERPTRLSWGALDSLRRDV